MIRKQIIVGFVLIILISVLFTSIYKLTRIDSFQIRDIEVIGGKTIPHSEVETVTQNELNGTYFKLVPKRFALTYPESKIKTAVLNVDRIKNVEVDRDNDVVSIIYEEYVPVALWCKEKADESCLFLDINGYAFAMAPELKGSAFVRFIEIDKVPEKQTSSWPREFIENNLEFIEQLETELGLYVTHVEKLGDYDIEYTVSGDGKIKVSQTVDLEQSFKNLRTILQSEEFVHLENGTFQYIDLRFGDKVFVNEEVDYSDESASSTGRTISE